MSSIHVQKIILAAGKDDLRIPLDWDQISDTGHWKTISFVRNKPTWIEAKIYPHLSAHPRLASSLLLLKSPSWDTTLAIYPVSTLSANNDLLVDTSSNLPIIQANVRRVIPEKETEVYVVCVLAKGRASERVIVQTAVEEARKLVHGRPKADTTSQLWDALGICTWESFRAGPRGLERPNKQMLLDLVPSFPIKTYLIDDGWQDIRESSDRPNGPRLRRLYSFGCWDGMGATMPDVVSSLKAKGIQDVGVWLTLQGYWGSIDPNSPLMGKYHCKPHPTARDGQPRGGVNIPLEQQDPVNRQWLPSPEKAASFWQDWFSEMKSWGIDFVKVDNQAHSDIITSPTAMHTQQSMWTGMLEAAEKVWGSVDRVIMCMSHNERMFNGPGGLDSERPSGSLVFRNSDDFNLQFDNAHADHVHVNTYQSILTDRLSLVPDFDMFASNPPDRLPTYHALLRALCPGPMLLSDTPDIETDTSLLAKLTANSKDGKLKAVKTSTTAQALPGRWFWDNVQGGHDGPAMLAYTNIPAARGAIIGAWNCQDAKTSSWARDKISLRDIEDALETNAIEDEYALWTVGHSQRNGQRAELVATGGGVEMGLELSKGECEAIIVARVWQIRGHKIAVVGMLDKFATLAGLEVGVKDDHLIISTRFASDQLSVLDFGKAKPEMRMTIDGVKAAAEPVVEAIGGAWLLSIAVGGVKSGSRSDSSWEVSIGFD